MEGVGGRRLGIGRRAGKGEGRQKCEGQKDGRKDGRIGVWRRASDIQYRWKAERFAHTCRLLHSPSAYILKVKRGMLRRERWEEGSGGGDENQR